MSNLIRSVKKIVFNIKDYGAVADGQRVADGAMTATSAVLTSATASFKVNDVGKSISVEGAAGLSGNTHNTTILSYQSSTQVTLASVAGTTVSNARVDWGTNNATAMSNANSAADTAGGGTIYIPASTLPFIHMSTFTPSSGVNIRGDGNGSKLRFFHSPTGSRAGIDIAGISDVTIRDLVIDAYGHGGNDYALRIINSYNVLIDRVNILDASGFGIFITADSSNITDHVWVTNCTLNGRGTNDVIGGGPANSTTAIVRDIWLLNNHLIQDASIGTNYGNAIDLVAPYNFNFQGNHTEGFITFGNEQSPHKFSIITDNILKPPPGKNYTAILVIVDSGATATGQGILITNNVIQDGVLWFSNNKTSEQFASSSIIGNVIYAFGANGANGAAGIRVTRLDRGLIANNQVYSSGVDGIRLDNVTNSSIVSNFISDSTQYGIKEVNSCDNNFIAHNKLLNNTSGAYLIVGASTITFNNPGATDTGYKVGGTDVAVADGGTGASAASGARTNLGVPNIAGDTFTGDIIVPDEAYGSAWNGSLEVPTKNAVYDKIEALAPGGMVLKTSGVVTGSASNILTISGLDLDTDKVYKVYCYINAASGGSPIVGWQINADTASSNYRYVRISSDGSSLSTARLSVNNFGTGLAAGDTMIYEYTISKKVSGEIWGQTGLIPYGTLGSMNFRQFGIGWIGTANLTSLSIIDTSGSSYLDVGTAMQIYTLGF